MHTKDRRWASHHGEFHGSISMMSEFYCDTAHLKYANMAIEQGGIRKADRIECGFCQRNKLTFLPIQWTLTRSRESNDTFLVAV